MEKKFLPVTPDEVRAAGQDVPDFVYVCGDAYVDHPSFGAAIIGRVLEDAGFVVAMLPGWGFWFPAGISIPWCAIIQRQRKNAPRIIIPLAGRQDTVRTEQ